MGSGTVRQLFTGLIATISVMCMGIAMGWSSPTLQKFTTESPIKPPPSADQISWMIAFLELGNLFTPVPTGILLDVVGRQKTLIIIGPIFVISWLLMYFFRSITCVYFARILQGLACGIIYTAVPIYLGEISGPEVRGAVSTLFQGLMYIGVMYSYVTGAYFSYDIFTLFCLAVAVVYSLVVIFIPESPYFLLMKSKQTKAESVLKWFRDSGNINDEMQLMKENVDKEMEDRTRKYVFKTKTDVKLFFIAQFLGCCQIMTNMYAILAYSSLIFDKSSHLFTPDQYTLFLGVVTLISTIPSAVIVDILGRKPLLIGSSIISGTLELLIGVYFFAREKNILQDDKYGWSVCVLISTLSFCYSFGLGPIVPTIQCELFPTNTRGIAFGLTILITTITALCNIKLFQIITDSPILGMSSNFFCGSFFCFFVAIFTKLVLPETKGRTFAEIQLLFHKENEGQVIIVRNT